MQSAPYRKRALLLGSLLGILFWGCLLFLLLWPNLQKTNSLTALIYRDGRLLHTIHLDTVTQSYELRVESPEGHYNIILVSPGAIAVTEADCPDKLCVHMGTRRSSLLPITCLPNKLVIRLTNTNHSSQAAPPDAVTY